MRKFVRTVNTVLSSPKLFWVIVGILVFQATWLALSAQYPLAFDENFHFGFIKVFAEQWSPFFSSTPDNSAALGSIIREPSYLYHYLFSFPYRLISLVTQDEVHQIIALRFINIALFSAGLVAFRNLLLQIHIPRRLIHFALLMLVLIPVVPFLAAHINYDNLLFVLIPLTLSLALACGRALQARKPVPIVQFLLLVILLCVTSLVKYVYLPVALAIFMYLVVLWIRHPHKKQVFSQLVSGFSALGLALKVGLIFALIISSGLFLERYGANVVMYRDVAPPCEKVESRAHCAQFGPWARNQRMANDMRTNPHSVDANPLRFVVAWLLGLLHRLYFAINYTYANKPPLVVPFMLALVMTVTGLVLVARWGLRVLRQYPGLLLPLGATLLYSATLMYKNYTDYLTLGQLVAINGRYFIPLLPIVFVFIGLAAGYAINRLTKRFGAPTKTILASLIFILMLQGGGLLTFFVHSEKGWYWQDPTVIQVNEAAHNLISPLILQYDYSAITRLLVQ